MTTAVSGVRLVSREECAADLPSLTADSKIARRIASTRQLNTNPCSSRSEEMKALGAEFFGTFWLVLGGCGSAVLAAAFPDVGIGLLGVSVAFGLTVVTMAYAIGHISGCHLNPAVSIGLWSAGRMSSRELGAYIAAQVVGGILGAGIVLFIAKGAPAGYSSSARGLAANGYGAHSPGGYSLLAALVTEVG